MKRLLFTIHSMPIGGAERVLLDILNHFDYSFYQVDLLLYTNSGENLVNIPNNVTVLHVFQPTKTTLSNRVWNKIKKWVGLITPIEKFKTRKAIGNRNYDAIISFCQGSGHKLHTFLKDKANYHISWIHTDLSKENWGKLFFNNSVEKQGAAYNMMDEIIHVSQGVMDAFNKTFDISSKVHQRVIYNIVDTDEIVRKSTLPVEHEIKSDRFVFVNSGRIVSQKKQIRLIETAKILSDKGLEFEIWILGDGPLRPDLEKAIKKYSLQNCVKLVGFASNPYPYIKQADVFVLTSSQEGFPIVVCEALALGKPVISTNVVGPTELLGESEYGMLVSENVTDIANAMELLMKSETMRKRYSLAALERSKMFDTKQTMNEIYSLFDD